MGIYDFALYVSVMMVIYVLLGTYIVSANWVPYTFVSKVIRGMSTYSVGNYLSLREKKNKEWARILVSKDEGGKDQLSFIVKEIYLSTEDRARLAGLLKEEELYPISTPEGEFHFAEVYTTNLEKGFESRLEKRIILAKDILPLAEKRKVFLRRVGGRGLGYFHPSLRELLSRKK